MRLDYLVQEPTLVELQITDVAGTIVRRAGIDHPAAGPAFFEWDGRDEQGGVVPDGSYTRSLNELPFPVEVDTTPPDISWSYGEPRATLIPINDEGDTRGGITADRSWHVFDAHLKGWSGPAGFSGTELVFDPELDEDGLIRVDEDGRPIPRRQEGRLADAIEDETEFLLLEAVKGGGLFVAEDLAGNQTTVPVPPPPERLILATAAVPTPDGPSRRVIEPPLDPGRVYVLPPPLTAFDLGETVRSPETSELSFEYRQELGDWSSTGVVGQGSDLIDATVDFPALALPLDEALFGRFATDADARTVMSEEFQFRACESFFEIAGVSYEEIPGTDLARFSILVKGESPETISTASVRVTSQVINQVFPLSPIPPGPDGPSIAGSFTVPTPVCGVNDLVLEVEVTTATGEVFRHDDACFQLRATVPFCPFDLTFEREPVACEAASPDRIPAVASVANPLAVDVSVAVEVGPGRQPLPEFVAPAGFSKKPLLLNVAEFDEGLLDVFGRLRVAGEPPTETLAEFVDRTLVVDRTPPTGSIVAPLEDAVVCVGRDEPVDVLHLRAFEVTDSAGVVTAVPPNQRTCVSGGYLGLGGGSRLPDVSTGQSTLSWDVRDREDGAYTLRTTFCDRSGLETTLERHIVLRRDPPVLTLESDPELVFSPNGDGASDTATVSVRLDRPADVEAEVRLDGNLLHQIASAPLPAGLHEFVWDGRDAFGAVAPEDDYEVVVVASDDCGSSTDLTVRATVDLTPPTASLTRPVEDEAAGAVVPVRGIASDAHFRSYEIQFGSGPTPTDWADVPVQSKEVETEGPLGGWDTPATPGIYTLRLLVTDQADNVGEAHATVDVQPRTFIDRFAVTPDVLSPNGDGASDTATFEYTLLAQARVTLTIDLGQPRTLVDDALQDAGTYAVVWDGLDGLGGTAADGTHTADLLATAEGASGSQAEQLEVVVDTTPPLVDITAPAVDACVIRDSMIEGSITDARLTSYTLIGLPPGGDPLLLDESNESRVGVLGSLVTLSEGRQTLSVVAEDAAGNRATLDRDFIIDSIAPVVRINTPVEAGILAANAGTVSVTGRDDDDNLVEAVLSFGPGIDPPFFAEIARTTLVGNDVALGDWDVSSLSDGSYTLRLIATD